MQLSDKALMGEVKRVIAEGKTVRLPVRGRSMLPFIVGGRDSVELHPLRKEPASAGATVAAACVSPHHTSQK